jgi:hypothetical protein
MTEMSGKHTCSTKGRRFTYHPAIEIGRACPCKVLVESAPRLLDLANPRALDNANTPAECDPAWTARQSSPQP